MSTEKRKYLVTKTTIGHNQRWSRDWVRKDFMPNDLSLEIRNALVSVAGIERTTLTKYSALINNGPQHRVKDITLSEAEADFKLKELQTLCEYVREKPDHQVNFIANGYKIAARIDFNDLSIKLDPLNTDKEPLRIRFPGENGIFRRPIYINNDKRWTYASTEEGYRSARLYYSPKTKAQLDYLSVHDEVETSMTVTFPNRAHKNRALIEVGFKPVSTSSTPRQ